MSNDDSTKINGFHTGHNAGLTEGLQQVVNILIEFNQKEHEGLNKDLVLIEKRLSDEMVSLEHRLGLKVDKLTKVVDGMVKNCEYRNGECTKRFDSLEEYDLLARTVKGAKVGTWNMIWKVFAAFTWLAAIVFGIVQAAIHWS